MIIVILELIFPVLTGKLIDSLVKKTNSSIVICLLLIIGFVGLMNQILKVIKSILFNKFSETTKNEVRKSIVNILRRTNYCELHLIDSVKFTQKVNLDLNQIILFLMDNTFLPLFKWVQYLIILIYIFDMDFFLGSIVVIFLPVYVLFYFLYSKKLFQYGNLAKQSISEYYQAFNAQVLYIDDIIHLADYKNQDTKFDSVFKGYYRIFKKYIGINLKFDFVQGFVALLLNLIMFGVCSYRIINGSMEVGALTVLMSFFSTLLLGISYYFDLVKNYQLFKASLTSIETILRLKTHSEGNLEFNEKINDIKGIISFGYTEDKPLYKNFRISFSRGNIYGIIGDNGQGKSTIYKLISGIIKSKDDSDIRINGVDINYIDTVSLRRRHISFVKQEVYANTLTIEDYILSELSYIDLNAVIFDMKDKNIYSSSIETLINEKRKMKLNELSGGDLKTIFLLLSLLDGKEVKIYDEPTVNLDAERKKWFIHALEMIKQEHLVIVITHDAEIQFIFDFIIDI